MARELVGREWSPAAPYCIQIEAVEGCNLRCGFCGIRGIREAGTRGALSGPFKYAAAETVAATAQQAARAGWSPRVEFAMHGEPTLHPDLPLLVRAVRHFLPRVHLLVTTNGIPLLDGAGLAANLDALYAAGVNLVALDDYRPHRVAPEARRYSRRGVAVREYPADPAGNPHRRMRPGEQALTIVEDISEASAGNHATLNNHAGAAAPLNDTAAGRPCAKPFREIAVRWDGAVAICCNDWRGDYRVGNVTAEGLVAIWRSAAMQAARRKLIAGERDFGPCAGCDALSYRPGLLPDGRGQLRLPAADAEDAAAIAAATAGPGYAEPVRRKWELPVVAR